MRAIIILLLFPLLSYSQDFKSALEFQNLLRGYDQLTPLKHSEKLDYVAQKMADEIAAREKIFFDIFDDYGQSVFSTENFTFGRDYFLEASVGWVVGDSRDNTLSQILCKDCREIGLD